MPKCKYCDMNILPVLPYQSAFRTEMYHNKTNHNSRCAYCNSDVECNNDTACMQKHMLEKHHNNKGNTETVARIEYPNINMLFKRIYDSIRYKFANEDDKKFADYMKDIDIHFDKNAIKITMADMYIFAYKHINICRKLSDTIIQIDESQYLLSNILTSLETWLEEFTPNDIKQRLKHSK